METVKREKLKQSEMYLINGLHKKQNQMLGNSLLQLDQLLYLQKSISLLDFEEIKKVIVAKLPYILDVRYFTLFLYDKGKRRLNLTCHNHPNLESGLSIYLDESGPMKDALEEGRYILETNFSTSKYFNGKKNPLFNNQFFVCAPLMIENEIVGVLNLNDNEKGVFNVGDLDYVLTVTELLSLSISNALLFERVETLSLTDGLTNLNNHQHMQSVLKNECVRSQRYKSPLSVVMLDVDHFKNVNDSFGHAKGDEVLIDVAQILKEVCRSNDIAARYGGEEFVLILPETGKEGAFQIAERIRMRVASHPFVHEGRPFNVTISCGVTEYDEITMNPAKLLDLADQALYEAKQSGRNRTVCGDTRA